jgi:hypothetical protein
MQSGKCSILSIVFVIIIIFFVAAILFPVFTKPYPYPRKSICQSNLKQCAQALKMYTDDYDGKLPSSRLVSGAKRWNTRDYLTFGTTLGKYPPEGRRQTWSQVLYDNMRNKDIMWCTSDGTDKTDPDAQTSYWYKLANDKAWYGIGCDAPRQKMGDYGYESDQLAFYEHAGWHFGDTSGRLKNGLQINASFLDTHVETILLTNATSGDPINCAANSNGEPMYYNCSVEPKHGYVKTQTGPANLTDPAQCYDKL